MSVTQALLSRIAAIARRGNGGRERGSRANRLSPVLSNRWEGDAGVGQSWMPLSYGEYYPRSALVYSAIRVRQGAIARVPLKVHRRLGETARGDEPTAALGPSGGAQRGVGSSHAEQVGASHLVQRLLDSPNPFWTWGDLWRATETYLSLWGSAF